MSGNLLLKRTVEQIKEPMSGSPMHERIQIGVSKLVGLKSLFFDKEYILYVTYPDIWYPDLGPRGTAIYIDGPIHKKPKQAEKDEILRNMLRSKGVYVIELAYEHNTKQEYERLINEIEMRLRN